MPPQKNSGNKKAKRETGVLIKNRRFIADLIQEFRQDKDVTDVYLGRVTKKLGNGRVEVFFVAKETEKTFDKEGDEVEKEVYKPQEKHALIKGSFRGKGKHSVWIDVGTPVIIADNGLNTFLIMAVLTPDELKDIAKEIYVDQRILNGVTDTTDNQDSGFHFENDSEVEIDDI